MRADRQFDEEGRLMTAIVIQGAWGADEVPGIETLAGEGWRLV